MCSPLSCSTAGRRRQRPTAARDNRAPGREPDERLQVADALRSSVEANLDPAVLSPASSPKSHRKRHRARLRCAPSGVRLPVPSIDNKKMLAKSLRLL